MKKKWLNTLSDIDQKLLSGAGGKSTQLARMHRLGMRLPETRFLSTDAYNAFVDSSGLRERILLELNRKPFRDMRWEEIWDCATRIRNLFLKLPFPADLKNQLQTEIEDCFQNRPVAVRSSAPEEDDVRHSFAGLHDSFVNLRGGQSIVEHIRKVWASLWSDAALLYRQELGLDAGRSAMAVVIQETIRGECSGVIFTQNPNAETQTVIEAVHGFNQGLVDGSIEPDRWILERSNGRIIKHESARRESYATAANHGMRYAPLPPHLAESPPLNPTQVNELFDWAMKLEKHQKHPQDIEWTIKDGRVFLLQTRPVSTLSENTSGDKRKWYLSLHRSYDNLIELRDKIEKKLIPEMIRTADSLSRTDILSLSDRDLTAEIQKRWEINHNWVNIYWADFIPFAHGMRLFGQVYNDVVHPDDPYEFVELLARTNMLSLERNRLLNRLADTVRSRTDIAHLLSSGQYGSLPQSFRTDWDAFIRQFGDLSCGVTGATQCDQEMTALARIVLEMAAHPAGDTTVPDKTLLEEKQNAFINRFPRDERQWATALLDLARASYQLRDDDNIHLGRIEAQLLAAVQEGRRRTGQHSSENETNTELQELKALLERVDLPSISKPAAPTPQTSDTNVRARQLIGQPAGPGIAKGIARVIGDASELTEFKYGEVLICDAVDPNMTFVVPLASGVIERRGGMLIHGAIIAREYGLPCVTGVSGIMDMVHTGDRLTVDGYLGIVTVDTEN